MADTARQGHELVRHWDAMVRACRPLVDNEQEAEDCAAAALLQLIEEPRADLRRPEAFLVTLATRRARDELQRSDRAGRLPSTTSELLLLLSDGGDVRAAAARLGIAPRDAPDRVRRTLTTRWPRTAAVAVAFAGLGRRNLMAGAPAVALLLVAGLTVVQLQSSSPVPGRAPGGQLLELSEPSREVRAPDPRARVVQSRPAAPRRATVRPPTAPQRRVPHRQVVVAVPGAAGGGLAEGEGDTVSGEQGPVEVLEACVEQLQVSVEHVGCEGRGR